MKKQLGVLALSAVLALPAFAQSSGMSAPQLAQPGNNRATLGGKSDNQRMANEVRHELVMLPYYSLFDNLQYQIQGNTVILSGQVANPTLKRDAENVVKKIEGVQQVQNNIQVLPASPMDDRIRRAEYRAIYGDSRLSRYAWGSVPPIHIIVNNGHVTLEGVVDSETDKSVAGIRAREVPGVFSVGNNLRVVPTDQQK